MKNKDKLIAVINKISKRENKHPEIVVSELNNMSEEELNKKLRIMDIFKDGGKIDYLLCLKKGGKTKKCGCGNKVEKAQLGKILHPPVVTINPGDTVARALLEDLSPVDRDEEYRLEADENGRTAEVWAKRSSNGDFWERIERYKTNPNLFQRIIGIKPLTDVQNAEINSVIKKQDGGNLAQTIISNMGVYRDPGLNQALLNRGTVAPKVDIPSNWSVQAPAVDMSKYEPAIEEEVIEENTPAFVPTNRRQARDMARHNGLSNKQFRAAWRNAKYAQNNYGDPNASTRDNIRAAAMSFAKPAVSVTPTVSSISRPAITQQQPTVSTSAPKRLASLGIENEAERNAIRDFNQGSFGDAFAQSRAAGKQTFNWRGTDYSTKYDWEVNQKSNQNPFLDLMEAIGTSWQTPKYVYEPDQTTNQNPFLTEAVGNSLQTPQYVYRPDQKTDQATNQKTNKKTDQATNQTISQNPFFTETMGTSQQAPQYVYRPK